ncbi:hypothetical protein [Haloarchaeobius sp. TZWWS8]|uniref:hypothetical protein n=1 Tax=Haloarchaeobius sp. TZWWS8 TaxID=3446121 RepID=UPI003EBA3097
MLSSPKVRKLVAGATAAYGLFSLLLPRQVAKLTQRLLLGPTYENTKELEPRDWYLESTRASGLGMLVGGLFGYILADRAGDTAAAEAEDDGPVTVDLDEAAEKSESDDESVDIDVV